MQTATPNTEPETVQSPAASPTELGASACSPSLPLVTGAITLDPADPEVLDILSKLAFVCAPIAHIFQRAGYPIPTHAEEEQGHIIMWMLGMYRDHGKDWRTKANATLNALRKANDKTVPTEGGEK